MIDVEELKKIGVYIEGAPSDVHFNYLSNRSTLVEGPIQFRSGRYDVGFVGCNTYIGGGVNTVIRNVNSIGRYCSIASNIIAGQVEHPTNFLSTHPLFYGQWKHAWPEKSNFYNKHNKYISKCESEFSNFRKRKHANGIVIGSDVWIGEGVFISDGINIGDGAIIAARSVVTKDVEPYAIVGGAPARHIKYRFEKEIINELLDIKWWLYDENVFINVDFSDISSALIEMKNNIRSGLAKLYLPNLIKLSDKFKSIETTEIDGFSYLSKNYDDVKEYFNFDNGFRFELNYKNRHERHYSRFLKGLEVDIDDYIISRVVREGDFVLDIGANIGLTSHIFFERGAGNVFGYEPVDVVFERLIKNSSRNYKYRAFNFAVTNENAKKSIFISQSHHQGSSLCKSTIENFKSVFISEDGSSSKQEVSCRKIDSLIFPRRIDLIKLDIEGCELLALQGAQEMLESSPPRTIILEAYENDYESVSEFLSKYFPYKYAIDETHDGWEFRELDESNVLSTSKPPMYVFSTSVVD
ncbi:FkbM family methyltransferase [Vibrio cholerae]